MCCSLRVASFPTFYTRQSILFATGAPDLDERKFGLSLGRLNASRLRVLFAVMGRPGRIAQALPLEQLQQSCNRAGVIIDACVQISQLLEATRHRVQREILRLAMFDFV